MGGKGFGGVRGSRRRREGCRLAAGQRTSVFWIDFFAPAARFYTSILHPLSQPSDLIFTPRFAKISRLRRTFTLFYIPLPTFRSDFYTPDFHNFRACGALLHPHFYTSLTTSRLIFTSSISKNFGALLYPFLHPSQRSDLIFTPLISKIFAPAARFHP